jgi:glycosyltransferase involved in cell wall biosynthesis
MHTATSISIVIPARNEAASLRRLLPQLRQIYPAAEIIVVNDASTDDTSATCKAAGASEIQHRHRIGNGGAVKTGARAAAGDVIVFMDGDGQHDPADIALLLEMLDQGYDMAVGARSRRSQANIGRSWANRFYNRLASWMTNLDILDLTSGFRAARADKFREFLYLLPNGFSYPTTITMAFCRAGYVVGYTPIEAAKRTGKSHIRPVHDGVRFLLIIFKIGTLYSPLKLFCPVSAAFFLAGLGNYVYTYFTATRFTNMSALMFTTSVLVLLIGLVSEQITQLIYRPTGLETASAAARGTAKTDGRHQLRRSSGG